MTMPAEIRNIADLYRILEEQPQWNEALRSRMLSAELLAMPQQLVALRQTAEEHTRQLVEQTAQLKELRQIAEENTRQVEGHTRQFVELRQTAEEHTRQLADQTAAIKELRQTAEEHTRQLAEHTRQFVELRQTAEEHTRQFVELRQAAEEHAQIVRNHTARMARMESDSSDLKGKMAEFKSVATSSFISSHFDLWEPKVLEADQLLAIARDLGLNRSDRSSFVAADLIFQGTDDAGQTILCAVEISWTVNQHDIDRARRNADLLQRALSHPTHAIAYGNRHEEDLIWEKVHWVKMKD